MTSVSMCAIISCKIVPNTVKYCVTATKGNKCTFHKAENKRRNTDVSRRTNGATKSREFKDLPSSETKNASEIKGVFLSKENNELKQKTLFSHVQYFANKMSRSNGWNMFNHITKQWEASKRQDNGGSINWWSQVFLAETILLWLFTANLLAFAADPVTTYACLLKECRMELAQCIGNPKCTAYVGCVESCNNSPNATACQMKCGDLFENDAVQRLNECAVSKKKCVPKKLDDGLFPKLQASAIVKSFNVRDFMGKWYISSGLNPLFDTFDCQVHEFYPLNDQLIGKWTWRISTPDGGFFTRSTVQKFVQDSYQPGILHYHDTGYLHNQDDWYIIALKIENKEDDYVFVYYRGNNDAWNGYGGAVVYTRTRDLPSSIVPDLEKAARKIGLDFTKFKQTDNMCGPEPSFVQKIQNGVMKGEQIIGKAVEKMAKSFTTEIMTFF